MLTLIGLGLWNEKDITIKGFERARKADRVYVELYTSKWHGDLKNLEKIFDKKVEVLKREDLEEDSDKILQEAKEKNVVLFVPGDPLIATTHASLLMDAKRKRIDTEVIHSSSIYSAIGESGLHIYKFGATATIPFPEKTSELFPISTYETIRENVKRGLHTLLLLDVISEKNRYMTPNEGMEILLKTEEQMKENIFTRNTKIVVFVRVGSEKPLLVYGNVKNLIGRNFGEPPFVMIVPGELHFTERDYLKHFEVKR